MKTLYFDNNATTAVAPEVRDVIVPFLGDNFYNPSSMYEQARAAGDAIDAARRLIAEALGGVDRREILFTSCATESNNTAIFGVMEANHARRHIITTAVEHPSVLETCREAERRGMDVTYLPVAHDGTLDKADFVRALRSDTVLVSIMHANNETGVVFPVAELSRITKETDPQIIFHTDATQSIGKLDVDLVRGMPHVDLLSFSGHKLHGPKGVGALFMRRGVRCRPFMYGGHQESGRRGGTENVGYIAGLGKACALSVAERDGVDAIAAMRDRLEQAIVEQVPCVEVNGRGAPRLPNTLNVAVHYIEGESILYQLNEEGICVSSGSACTSGSLDPSHVLKAMNVPFTAVHGSVRFSLSRYTTDAEVDRVIEVFPQVVKRLRALSPYWDGVNNKPREDVKIK
jgi:cysteine desulfurase